MYGRSRQERDCTLLPKNDVINTLFGSTLLVVVLKRIIDYRLSTVWRAVLNVLLVEYSMERCTKIIVQYSIESCTTRTIG